MSVAERWPQVGDTAVELRRSHRNTGADLAGAPVRVKTVTDTLVITSDGEKYSRASLRPVSEGRYSARQLVPAGDVRVLVARGRLDLSHLAKTAQNLSEIDFHDPETIVSCFARVVTMAALYRAQLAERMAEASRQEQESSR